MWYVLCDGDRLYGLFSVFVQAEDGIRDLVRSRVLGDVYKRQGWDARAGVGQDDAMAGRGAGVDARVAGGSGSGDRAIGEGGSRPTGQSGGEEKVSNLSLIHI